MIHTTLDFRRHNVERRSRRQQIDHSVHSFAHRRQFRFSRAPDRDRQLSHDFDSSLAELYWPHFSKNSRISRA
jgi:hypothetical protein